MILELLDYQNYLKSYDATEEGILTEIIESAEAEIVAFIKFDLESVEHTEILDGKDSYYLTPQYTPITAVDSIFYWDGTDWVELVESVDYERLVIKDESSIYLDGYYFGRGISNYKIVYTAGYTTMPYDIQLAMKKLVRLRWDETPMGLNRFGLTSKNNSGGIQSSLNFERDTEDKIFGSIAKYAHINI